MDAEEPRAVTFATRKGGVGKTALSINVADQLANRGYDVLLIDADPAGNATEGVGLEETYRADDHLGKFLYKQSDEDLGFTDIIYETGHGFDAIPSNQDLGQYERMIDSDDRFAILCIEEQIREPLLGEVYDYIVIDSPAATGSLMSDAALVGAPNVMVPMVPGEESVRGFEQMMEQQISKLRENRDVRILALIPNLCRNNNELTRLVDLINDSFPEYVPSFARTEMLETSPGPGVRERIAFKRAWREGVPLSTYEPDNDMLERLDELAGIVVRGGVRDE